MAAAPPRNGPAPAAAQPAPPPFAAYEAPHSFSALFAAPKGTLVYAPSEAFLLHVFWQVPTAEAAHTLLGGLAQCAAASRRDAPCAPTYFFRVCTADAALFAEPATTYGALPALAEARRKLARGVPAPAVRADLARRGLDAAMLDEALDTPLPAALIARPAAVELTEVYLDERAFMEHSGSRSWLDGHAIVMSPKHLGASPPATLWLGTPNAGVVDKILEPVLKATAVPLVSGSFVWQPAAVGVSIDAPLMLSLDLPSPPAFGDATPAEAAAALVPAAFRAACTTLVLFAHPLRPDTIRLLAVLPSLPPEGALAAVATHLRPEHGQAHVQTASVASDSSAAAARVRDAFAAAGLGAISVNASESVGHVLHERACELVPTAAAPSQLVASAERLLDIASRLPGSDLSALRIAAAPGADTRRLVAARDVAARSTVATLPPSACITAAASPPVLEMLTRQPAASSAALGIVLELAFLRFGAAMPASSTPSPSLHEAYAASLPADIAPSLLHCDDHNFAEAERLLAGTPLLESMRLAPARRREHLRAAIAQLRAKLAQPLPPWCGESALLWAHSMFRSRAMRVPPRGSPAMVPVFDLADHRAGSVSAFDGVPISGGDGDDEDGEDAVFRPAVATAASHFGDLPGDAAPPPLVLRLGRPLMMGDEVAISYGAHGNGALLLHYGFALADNAADTIAVALSPSPAPLLCLASATQARFVIGRFDVPPGLLEAAHALLHPSASLAATAAAPIAESEAPFSPLDASARSFFREHAQSRDAVAAARASATWLCAELARLGRTLAAPVPGPEGARGHWADAAAAYRASLALVCDATRARIEEARLACNAEV